MSDRLAELIDGHFHGTLPPTEQRELAGLLQSDAGARRAFAEHALWASGLGRALSQVRERAQASARWQRQPVRRWRPLAAAALLLVATGVGLAAWLMGGHGSNGSIAGHLLAGSPARGAAGQPDSIRLLGEDGSERRLLGGEAIPTDSRLVLGDDACAQVRLADGSELDLDRDTAVRFGGTAEAFSLLHGTVFCSVAKRPAGAAPFSVGLPEGRTATALGTRFELTAAAATTRLRVEEGRVRLVSSAGVSTAGPLQELQVAATGGCAPPTNIALHEIAAWKYRTAQVPAGTVVFEDGFDADTGGWEAVQLPGGPLRFAPFKGRSCLILPLKAGAESIIYARFPMRFRNFELRFRLHVEADKQVYIWAAFNVPDAPLGTVITRGDAMPTDHGQISDDWIDYHAVIHGERIHLQWFQNGQLKREATGRIPQEHGHFTRVGLGTSGATEASVLRIDRFTITNLGD